MKFLALAILLSCSTLGGSSESKFRVPVADAQRIADLAKAAFTAADVDGDGYVDNAEWVLIGNVVIAEVIRIYQAP